MFETFIAFWVNLPVRLENLAAFTTHQNVTKVTQTSTAQSFSVYKICTDTGCGSGTALSQNTLLTNAHVIHSGSVRVMINDRPVAGTVIKQDTSIDLALVQINENTLIPTEIAPSSDIKTNLTVIGYPLGGYQKSVKAISVSGAKCITPDNGFPDARYEGLRCLEVYNGEIQHGNSGGCLCGDTGLVGVPYAANDRGNGFVLPVELVKEFLAK